MECSEFRRMISRELDGEIDQSALAELEAHCAACAGCRRFRELSLAGLMIHRSMRDESAPPSLLPSILSAVEASSRTAWMRGWMRFAVPTAAAAAAVLGVWVGGLIHESCGPANAENHADVLELDYLGEYPPGSFGDVLMASNEGGGNE